MKYLNSFICGLGRPLKLFNLVGGSISGIWLLLIGEWGVVVFGVCISIVLSFVIIFATMPSQLFFLPATYLGHKKSIIARLAFYLLSFLGDLYIVGLMSFWCVGIFFAFYSNASGHNLIPMLIWSYGIAFAPWIYLALKDQQSGNAFASLLVVFVAEISYMVMLLIGIFSDLAMGQAVMIYIMYMSLVLAILMIIEYQIKKEEKDNISEEENSTETWGEFFRDTFHQR